MEQYTMIEKIGEGAYGKVYRGLDKLTDEPIAIKIIPVDANEGVPSTAIREISVLKEMQHENIVRLLNVVLTEERLYLIFEYLDMDLKRHMQSSPEFLEDPQLVKRFLYQMLCGVDYCHSRRVLHRDLKPQNLLIDASKNVIKLADFGLARAFNIPVTILSHEELYTTVVDQNKDIRPVHAATLWYRPPEILLGSQQYSISVDVWSIGCIFAEMVNQKPLFPGNTEIDQLFHIFKIMGTPDEDTWPGVTSLSDYKTTFRKWSAKDLATLVPKLDEVGLDLLTKMLCMDPKRRITARVALQHEYFEDIKSVP